MGAPAPVRTTVVALVLLATVAVTRFTTSVTAAAAPTLGEIPAAIDGWAASPAPPLDPDVARVLAADQYLHRYYQGPAGVIEMDIAYYGQPRIGANMHSPLNCLPGNGWSVSDVRNVLVTTPTGQWPVRDTVVERRGVSFALTYWFQSRNRIVGDELWSRFYLLGDALRRQPADAGLVRLMMQTDANAADERTALAGFAAHLIPEISAHLR